MSTGAGKPKLAKRPSEFLALPESRMDVERGVVTSYAKMLVLMGTILLLMAAVLAVALVTMLGCLQASLSSISRHEVRKKAQDHERGASALYILHARGFEVIVSFIILRILLSVSVVVIMIALLPIVLSVLASTLLITFVSEIIGRFYLQQFFLAQTDWLMPVLNKLLLITLPLSRPIGQFLDKKFARQLPVIHGKQHLLEMLEAHRSSVYSDIDEEGIEIAKHALNFGSKQIREIMIPKAKVASVSAEDPIGPIIMDELHKSGHSRFVVTSDDERVVGVLYLKSLLFDKSTGKIKDLMDPEVFYVHEELPLGHALQAFIKTRHHLFVVVNNFEDFVGILTLEDVIEQIIGKQIIDEFDKYDNPREVAALRAKKHHPTSAHKVIE